MPGGKQARFLAFTRDRHEHDRATRGRRLPAPAESDEARIGREIELQVAFDADLGHAGLAQPCRVGLGLRERGSEACERWPALPSQAERRHGVRHPK